MKIIIVEQNRNLEMEGVKDQVLKSCVGDRQQRNNYCYYGSLWVINIRQQYIYEGETI